MKINRYKIKNQSSDIPVPGAFVFESNDSGIINGFVNDYDEDTRLIDICLFEERDEDTFINNENYSTMTEKSNEQNVMTYLKEICDADINIKNMWIDVVKKAEK